MKTSEMFKEPGRYSEAPPLPPKAVAQALLDPRAEENFESYVKDVKALMHGVGTTALTNAAEAAKLSEWAARAKVAHKGLEALRVSAVSPLNDKVKAINKKVKIVQQAIDGFVERVDLLLMAWTTFERARVAQETRLAEEKQRRAAEALAAAEVKLETAATQEDLESATVEAVGAHRELMVAEAQVPLPAARGIRTDTGTSFTKTDWVFDVVAPERVPREYLKVDDQAIRRAVAAGTREIPGVSIHEEEGMVHRTS